MTESNNDADALVVSDSEGVSPPKPAGNRGIDGRSEPTFSPPNRDYDFRDGLDFDGSWPSRELVESVLGLMARYHSATALSPEERTTLSKKDIVRFSPWGERQTRKALKFLDVYDAVEYLRPGRKVVYGYNPESAMDDDLREAIAALNSQDMRDEYCEMLRERAKEAYLNRVRSE